ncbi:MAG: tRNA pseudouridine(38-40) synthase TruA [Rickettsiales bacterium]|jgi:tRNA pseudouridine38-40 synthase|nr:tRNA pseudouridine(38-40) synthase TruA [Rickettsiales bacterium]
MSRYKLTLEYDGTNLIGWQDNIQGDSVQSLLKDAIFKFSGQHADIVAAGRTDAGVHALGMVAHFDIGPDGRKARKLITDNPPAPSCQTVMRAINFYLQQENAPVAVLDCEEVSDDFHARFSCIRRNYRYIILNRGAPAVLYRGKVWWIPRELDIEKMRAAAARLVGNHDFTSFRASECQAKSPVKTLDKVEVESTNLKLQTSRLIAIDFSARSFLHHQVRNMVGTIVEIGLGKPFDIDRIFAAQSRAAAGPTAPAAGLYFISAEYATHDCTECI